MVKRKVGPERLGAFSDGVIAVIITIMVLELKAPHEASMAALLALWPTFLSYALSYLFVGIVWVNHHHVLRYTENADSFVIWTNLAFLFFVSLIPFFTAYLADNRMNSFTTAVYAAEFLAITIAFMFFERAVTRQFGDDPDLSEMVRTGTRRNWTAFVLYSVAIPVAYVHPAFALVLIVGVTLLYFVPDAQKRLAR